MIFLACPKGFSVEAELYAVNHTSTDVGKIEMVQDFLYKQLVSFSGITAIDKRTMKYTGMTTNPNEDVILIHASIKENNTDLLFTIYAEQPFLQKQTSVESTYASYYKILTEARDILQQLFFELGVPMTPNKTNVIPEPNSQQKTTTKTSLSLESLSGTWSGEDNINKIVLLRGGRGFVIFNNGASMNISVQLQGDTVVCTQTGKPNASFFPELPREVALVVALNAKPIKWTLTLVDSKTLTGTKETLRQTQEKPTSSAVEQFTTSVTWTKQ